MEEHGLEQYRALPARLPQVDFNADIPVQHPRLSFYAATYEAAEVKAVTEAVRLLTTTETPLTQAAQAADADFRLYELRLDHPAAGLEAEEAAALVAYGMTGVEPGIDLFCVKSIAPAEGVLARFAAQLDKGRDALGLMTEAGRDVPALFGALIAARMAGARVVLEGDQAHAAALLLRALDPKAVSHCATVDHESCDWLAPVYGRAPFPLISAIEILRGPKAA
jgi:nicotinate-nucleotide--dimethylbenzimidazole phosphoribosyltransferase